MKKLLIIFLILFSAIYSFNSFAEWTYVTKTLLKDPKLNAKMYVDKDRIIYDSKLIYFWQLTDWVSEGGYGYLSAVARVVANCKLKKYKNLQIANYKNAMGTGKIVGNDKPHKEWQYTLPESTKEGVLRYVCNLK